MDDGARGRVLPRVEEAVDLGAGPLVLHLAVRQDERTGKSVVGAARRTVPEAVVRAVLDGRPRRHEDHVQIVGGCAYRSEAVEDPERATVRRQHEVTLWLLDGDVVDWHRGQVAFELPPHATIVERHPQASL